MCIRDSLGGEYGCGGFADDVVVGRGAHGGWEIGAEALKEAHAGKGQQPAAGGVVGVEEQLAHLR